MKAPCTISALAILTTAAHADLTISRVVIAAGGNSTSGGPYRLTVAIGQVSCGEAATGGTLGLDVGFLVPADPACSDADLSGSSDPNSPAYGNPDGVVDSSDFFYFLDQFALGNTAVADLTGSSDPNDPAYGNPDGVLDASDFFFYLDSFVAGCP